MPPTITHIPQDAAFQRPQPQQQQMNVVGVDEEAHEGTGQAGGRLNDVRHVLFAGGLPAVRSSPECRGVRGQVEVGTVGDA